MKLYCRFVCVGIITVYVVFHTIHSFCHPLKVLDVLPQIRRGYCPTFKKTLTIQTRVNKKLQPTTSRNYKPFGVGKIWFPELSLHNCTFLISCLLLPHFTQTSFFPRDPWILAHPWSTTKMQTMLLVTANPKIWRKHISHQLHQSWCLFTPLCLLNFPLKRVSTNPVYPSIWKKKYPLLLRHFLIS